VEYDASAAAHLFALAMATGGSVTVENAVSTRQPDAGILRIFEEMGAGISASTGPVTVRRGGLLRGIDTDLSTMPDQVATLAVLGALADGPTLLTGIGVVRGHETDRIAALEGELSKLGAAVEAGPDWLRVEGGRQLHGGRVDTHDDHRLAMAFTALGAVVEGIEIASPGCVAKTYPRWWDDAAALGLRLGG
ncbi:MAG: 3-phosphoshikimate 1-carboxyvinyltransferase, partial [Acidimicrobiales bacterium]